MASIERPVVQGVGRAIDRECAGPSPRADRRDVRERVGRRLQPRRATVDGPDGRDDVDELGETRDRDAVRVAQERDQQAPDDQRVGQVVRVLGQGRRPPERAPSRASSRSRCSVRCQTFHSSTLRPIRRRLGSCGARSASTMPATRLDHPIELRRAGEVAVDRSRTRPGRRSSAARCGRSSRRRARAPSPPTRRTSASSEPELPHATSSIDGSTRRIALAGLGRATAVLGRSRVTDLPRAVHLVAEAPGPDPVRLGDGRWPPAGRRARCPTARCSTRRGREPPSAPRVPRFTASIGSTPTRRAQAMNSSVPTMLGSIDRQARSCRVGRRSRGPTPSSQS